MNDRFKLLSCAVGIFICYFYFGIIQERITRGKYGEAVNPDGTVGEKFTCTLALVFIQCLCNWLFAKAILTSKPQKPDQTHYGYYASSAITYLLAMVSSNMALRWVNYPAQVVAKSAKPIPVMLLGVLIGRKSYTAQKYFFVLLIVVGVVLFMYKEGKSGLVTESTGLGETLLLLSLSMDGLTGAIQERMRASSSPTAQHMMLSMNSWSTMFLAIALLITGEGMTFLAFANQHPKLVVDLATLAVAGAFGQLFIFMMVADFGPLPCSIVTTTRKFFTVLISVIFFGNALTSRQWLGTVLVFSGLFADMILGKKTQIKGAKLLGDEKKTNL